MTDRRILATDDDAWALAQRANRVAEEWTRLLGDARHAVEHGRTEAADDILDRAIEAFNGLRWAYPPANDSPASEPAKLVLPSRLTAEKIAGLFEVKRDDDDDSPIVIVRTTDAAVLTAEPGTEIDLLSADADPRAYFAEIVRTSAGTSTVIVKII